MTSPTYFPIQAAPPSDRSSTRRALLSVAICIGVIVIGIANSSACLHWFIIPAFACGVICCFDALLLLSNDGRNVFQPVPLVGAYGLYLFLIAPVIHVAADQWFTSEVWAPKELPDDWRTWLGYMGILNLLGLGIYKGLYERFTRFFLRRRATAWPAINAKALRSNGVLLVVVTFLLQIYIYYSFGGVGEFVASFTSRGKGGFAEFSGLGWLFAIAESFPLLLVIACSVIFRTHLRRISSWTMFLCLAAVCVLVLFCGGLRGSRGNTVYTVIYMLGVIHMTVRRLGRKWLVTCGAISLLFMYIYGFYKSRPALFADPASLIKSMESADSRAYLEQSSGRSFAAILLGDLDRSDLQAYLLFRMLQPYEDVELAYGRTYLEGAMNFVPYRLFKYRPPGKLKYGTNAVFGRDTYAPGRHVSLKIYGVAGETMLNFGPFSGPLGFIVLAAMVGFARALYSRASFWSDSRRYYVPIVSLLCVIFLSSDLDNVLYVLFQHVLMPFVLISISSSRLARGRFRYRGVLQWSSRTITRVPARPPASLLRS